MAASSETFWMMRCGCGAAARGRTCLIEDSRACLLIPHREHVVRVKVQTPPDVGVRMEQGLESFLLCHRVHSVVRVLAVHICLRCCDIKIPNNHHLHQSLEHHGRRSTCMLQASESLWHHKGSGALPNSPVSSVKLARPASYLSASISEQVGLVFEGVQEADFKVYAVVVALPVSGIRRVHIDQHKGPKVCHNTPAHCASE